MAVFPVAISGADATTSVQAEQAAYRETAGEDAEICARITAGRRALYQQDISETGPYQSPMENGMRHLHQFLRRHLEPHL